MSTAALKAYHQVLPPRSTGQQAVQSVATGAAAVKTSIWSMSPAPEGKVMLTFEAGTTDCYIRLRGDAGAAGTTAANGMIVKAGQPGVTYWVDSLVDLFVDHLATGAGTLKWYVASPVYDGRSFGA